jgi:hypothetical protein
MKCPARSHPIGYNIARNQNASIQDIGGIMGKAPEKSVSIDFMEKLGFELPDEVCGFYLENGEIVFNLQVFEEVSDCQFKVSYEEERFPLTEEQLAMLKEAGLTDPDGYQIQF